MDSKDSDVWIYHERQEALLCGQHALNNLIQDCVFSAESLAEMAHQLDEYELSVMAQNNEGGTGSKEYLQRLQEGSGNVDPQGNFSIQVLRSALQTRYDIELPNIRQQDFANVEPTLMEGFICNKQAHWFAIRKINGRYWNLNSMQERPEEISHFNVAAEIDRLIADGYSVFCVAVENPLPPACLSVQEMERRKDRQQRNGRGGNWWREEDLLKGLGSLNGGNGSAGGDPWKNAGSGMRLDGKSTTFSGEGSLGAGGEWTQDLTEEEQIQMAMAASLENPVAPPTPEPVATLPTVPVPEEPPAATPGSVRIQFRLPSKRLVRRFLESDTVSVVLSFCREQETGKNLDVLYGFPPKDLKPLADKTIADAKLAGESIQGRYI